MTTANSVTRHIINYSIDEKSPISSLMLQKVLYLCQFESYKRSNRPLFGDDFEAWRYGPVVPSAYSICSIFGDLKITRKVEETEKLTLSDMWIVENVTSLVQSLKPWEVTSRVQYKGSPWDVTFRNSGMGSKIPKELIRLSAFGKVT